MNVVFIGTSPFGAPALQRLYDHPDHSIASVISQPDRPAGRQMKLLPCPIKELAMKLHMTVFQPEKINQKSAIDQIRYLKPDVIIVAAYGQIIPKAILDIPQYGCLNIHGSILPRYRGAAPIQRAIEERERESGVTIMWMDEGLDTGDILLIKKTKIKDDDNSQTLHDRLAEMGAEALLEAFKLIEKGKAPRVKQDSSLSTYAKKLKKEDGKIDWSKSKRDLDSHIRAMTPWPSAYTWVPDGADQKMLKVFSIILSRSAKGKPGEVVKVDSHGILVACGGERGGGLLLREVQMEGKKRMHAADFARGFNLQVGTILV
jgi:methionyl-tRNA formyltransferase